MNSIWNKNIESFKNRFPQLEQQLPKETCSEIIIEETKNGSVTATENGLLLHSKYNPQREAQSLISSFDSSKKEAAVFLGFGLGHALIEFSKKNKNSTLIVFEKDVPHFFSALEALDWTEIFAHEKLILALGASVDDAASLINGFKSDQIQVFKVKSQTAHAESYFAAIESKIEQTKQKEEINTNTLEKFASLWTSNSFRNLDYMDSLSGVKKYTFLGNGLPFVILAAGPSLQKILPHLAEIKKRAVIVCVDTAVHACLKNGVEPDFIILADPQYYCALHLEFLECPSSVLITEIAAYPMVFEFNCREKVLFSSLFPIGNYFEKKSEEMGKLAAGGSVTTTAWDFARLCGAKEIYIAGMDLGFPGKQTHIQGSQFEEKSHMTSSRIKNAETDNAVSLFGAAPFFAKDYNGNSILTDKRMSLFSWWFENETAKANAAETKTFTLTPESLCIKGIEKYAVENFLAKKEIAGLKNEFFINAEKKQIHSSGTKSIKELKKEFFINLEKLESLSKRGINICRKASENRLRLQEYLGELSKIDSEILNSECKDAASLVFPTQRQLAGLSANLSQDKQTFQIQYSNLIYSELLKSVRNLQKFI